MTPQQIALVRSSFARVQPVSGVAAEAFYGRLFRIAPETRALFGADMAQQGRQLMTMLQVIVAMLDQPGQLADAARRLGERHAGYGVRDVHYASAGHALIDTLDEALRAHFTADVREAWEAAYSALAALMIDAQRGDAGSLISNA